LDGIWWIACTGAMWNQMPDRFGKWNSVWRCFRRWCGSGLWKWAIQQISGKYNELLVAVMLDASHQSAHQDASKHPLPADEQKLGKTIGGRNTKLSVAVNLVGLPVSFDLVCGNEHDSLSRLLKKRACGAERNVRGVDFPVFGQLGWLQVVLVARFRAFSPFLGAAKPRDPQVPLVIGGGDSSISFAMRTRLQAAATKCAHRPVRA